MKEIIIFIAIFALIKIICDLVFGFKFGKRNDEY